jgi:hypothetical protein
VGDRGESSSIKHLSFFLSLFRVESELSETLSTFASVSLSPLEEKFKQGAFAGSKKKERKKNLSADLMIELP